MHRDIHELKGN